MLVYELTNNTNMITRSQAIIKPLYEVNIDFDEASRAWLHNKKKIGNGSYKYICTHTVKNKKRKIDVDTVTDTVTDKQEICGKKCYQTSEYCYHHTNQIRKLSYAN